MTVMKQKRNADDKRISAKTALRKVGVAAEADQPKPKKGKSEDVDDALVEEVFSSILGRKPKQAAVEIIEPKSTSSRDEEYYIHYQQPDQNTEKGYAMKEGTFFEQARSAEVSFTGDDNDTMKKQKNSLIWDRKKKRFVHSNNATKDLSGQVVKNEAGKKVNTTYKTKA